MDGAQAGPSSWQNVIRLRLEERDQRERLYDDMIGNYQRLARLARQHRDRSVKVLAAAGIGSNVGAATCEGSDAAPSIKNTDAYSSSEAESVRLAYVGTLEAQLMSLRNDLASARSAQAAHAARQKLSEGQMAERSERATALEADLAAVKEELSRMRRQDDDLKNNIEAKDKAIELLQDEMATLTLELGQAESRLEDVKRDNASLLQRWLDRMNSEAERMNEGNLFLQDVEKQRAAAGAGGSGSSADSGSETVARQAKSSANDTIVRTPKGKLP